MEGYVDEGGAINLNQYNRYRLQLKDGGTRAEAVEAGVLNEDDPDDVEAWEAAEADHNANPDAAFVPVNEAPSMGPGLLAAWNQKLKEIGLQ